MSQQAIQIFVARATPEEGLKLLPYDDETGKLVIASVGNLTWGIGFNLMKCGSPGLFAAMLAYLCAAEDTALSEHTWYAQANAARQSVFLDIAYNGGISGLLNGYPHMIAAAAVNNWTEASAQCTVENALLDKSRYAPLRKILLTGVSP